MAGQTESGKSFEWAIALASSIEIGGRIIDSKEQANAEKYYSELSEEDQDRLFQDARNAVRVIKRLERSFIPRSIELAPDGYGRSGDVRDVILRSEDGSELGISCKKNHKDLKHSRLSANIDFIKDWGIAETCTPGYWSSVTPVFQLLDSLASKESPKTWDEYIPDKANKVYEPILKGWSAELTRHCMLKTSSTSTQNLFRYLFGTHDYYKVINMPKTIELESYNFLGTLQTTKTPIPDTITNLYPHGSNKYIMELNDGAYKIQFRLHNASSRIEASLKFAVSPLKIPTDGIAKFSIKKTA